MEQYPFSIMDNSANVIAKLMEHDMEMYLATFT